MPRKYLAPEELRERIEKSRIIKRLKSEVPRGEVYLVGGAIRDLALGKAPKDYDFAIRDLGDKGLFERILKKKAFILGKKPMNVFRVASGTLTIDLWELQGSIEEDLKRRDFTINSVAYDLRRGIILDPLGGLEDLAYGKIRIFDKSVITSDPLRMLKGIRHFCEMDGFSLDPHFLEVIAELKSEIRRTPGERIKYELDIILLSKRSYEGLRILGNTGLLYEIFPELFSLKDFDEKMGLEIRALDHTLLGISFMRRFNRIVKLGKDRILDVSYALLFHDLGKPETFTRDEKNGVVHFFGHERVSEKMAVGIMERLKFSNSEMKRIRELIRNHMWIFLLNKGEPTQRATKRLLLRMGELTPSLVLLTLCDMFGTTLGKENETTRKIVSYSRELLRIYDELKREPPPKLVNGYDLLSLGYFEGPKLGMVLKEIREKQLLGEITTREEALSYARERLKES